MTFTRSACGVLALLVCLSLLMTEARAISDAVELYRFASPSTFDTALQIEVARDNRLTTAVRLYSDSQDDYVLQYTPGGTVVRQDVPDRDRILGFAASTWGSVVTVDQDGSTPMAIYAAPFGEPLAEIFRGTENGSHAEPAVSDSGAVAFLARASNHHGLRDAWLWKPDGSPAQLLPDLGENRLGEFVLIDGEDRVTTTHQFTTPATYTGLYRHEDASGWTDLTAGTTARPSNSAGMRGRDVNFRGDIAFVARSPAGYTLQLYQEDAAVITPVLDVTRPGSLGSLSERTTDVYLGDNGELLAVVGGSGFDDQGYDILFRTPGGDLDLATLLPAGESLAAYPSRPRVAMSHEGRLVIETVNDATGRWSYHYYDYRVGQLLSPSALGGLDGALQWIAPSDDERVYFWRDAGAESALYAVTVPEPGGLLLLTLTGTLEGLSHARQRTTGRAAC